MTLPPFDLVVRQHGATVLRVGRAIAGDNDADDVWAETFLAALRSYDSLRSDSNTEAWLVSIARSKAIDAIRRRAQRPAPTAAIPDVAVATEPPPDELLSVELTDALQALAPKQRACVTLHHLAGLPHTEVAELVGCSHAAARRSAADGLANIRAALAQTASAPMTSKRSTTSTTTPADTRSVP